MRWLGNIIISIAVPNLDEIYSYVPVSIVSPLANDSTITILQHVLRLTKCDVPVEYHIGRTVIVKLYGGRESNSHYIEGIKIDSCLDLKTTRLLLKKILGTVQ